MFKAKFVLVTPHITIRCKLMGHQYKLGLLLLILNIRYIGISFSQYHLGSKYVPKSNVSCLNYWTHWIVGTLMIILFHLYPFCILLGLGKHLSYGYAWKWLFLMIVLCNIQVVMAQPVNGTILLSSWRFPWTHYWIACVITGVNV